MEKAENKKKQEMFYNYKVFLFFFQLFPLFPLFGSWAGRSGAAGWPCGLCSQPPSPTCSAPKKWKSGTKKQENLIIISYFLFFLRFFRFWGVEKTEKTEIKQEIAYNYKVFLFFFSAFSAFPLFWRWVGRSGRLAKQSGSGSGLFGPSLLGPIP